jgi:transcriptional regulator with XRE-family HTH domain
MSTRSSRIDEAARRAHHQLDGLVRDLRAARLMAGLSQATVASSVGRSRELIAGWENRRWVPGVVDLVRWGAVLGLDVPIRAYPRGSPLRDAGQLRTLSRARKRIGEAWGWRTEVPVSADPRDGRAVDAVISRDGAAIGLEVITRLTDAQAQVRRALLKQEAAGLDRMVLILADTRHNRLALGDAQATLRPAFALETRRTLRDLREGRLPPANGVVLV